MGERTGRHGSRRATRADDHSIAGERLASLARPAAAGRGAADGRQGGWVPGPPEASPPDAPPAQDGPVAESVALSRLALLRSAALPAPAATGVVLVLLVGLVAGGWLLLRGRPAEVVVPQVSRSAPATTLPVSGTPSPAAATTLVVHVAGAVRRPGLVRLAAGSRVADAVDAAGGTTRDAEPASVNLARPLVDGEQLVVLAKGEAPSVAPVAPPGAGGSGAAAAAPLDLNVATQADLEALPGVGPVLAQRILDWRAEHGRFSSVDELREISGIGEATFADIEPLVRV